MGTGERSWQGREKDCKVEGLMKRREEKGGGNFKVRRSERVVKRGEEERKGKDCRGIVKGC